MLVDASQGGCASGAFVLPMVLASLGGIRVDGEGAAAALAAPSLSPTCVCCEKQSLDSVCAESGGEREQGRCTYFCK